MKYAYAYITGENKINGVVTFRQKKNGVLVTAIIYDLPTSSGICKKDVFAFHIHSGSHCTGTKDDPYADANGHFDKNNCPHPSHSGDMPPLFGNDGTAYLSFLTNRFTVDDIIGKTVIIHSSSDDFKSQPAGNPGRKIACGEIKKSFFLIV